MSIRPVKIFDLIANTTIVSQTHIDQHKGCFQKNTYRSKKCTSFMWKLVNSSIIGVYWSFQAFESKLVSKGKENIKKNWANQVLHKSLIPKHGHNVFRLICTSISSIEILVFHVFMVTIFYTHFSAHNTTLILEIWAELCMNYETKIVIFIIHSILC